MTQVVNTNIPSLIVQRNLAANNNQLTQSLERLSSGLRINSAKDDPAGLAISNRFMTQVRGLNVAVKNANDAISYAQTVESSISEVTGLLQRIRDLALQASNSSYSSSDRLSLQEEVSELVDEIDRIANITKFNDNFVANGMVEELNFKISADAGPLVSVSGVDVRTLALGNQPGTQQSTASSLAASGLSIITAATLEISGFSFAIGSGATVDVTDAGFGGTIDIASNSALIDPSTVGYGEGLAKSLAARINDIREDQSASFDGVYANAYNSFNYEDTDASLSSAAAYIGTGALANGDLKINGVDIGPATVQTLDADGALSNAINAKSGTTGVRASTDSSGRLLLEADDGRDIIVDVASTSIFNLIFDGGSGTSDTAVVDNRYKSGQVIISAEDTISDLGYVTTTDDNNEKASGTLQNANVTTVTDANITVKAIDSALIQVDRFRASLGAVQTRFESAVNSLSGVSGSLEAAASRIRDADFAAETAKFTRAQLLQQSGIAILAQANVLPQQALSLLTIGT